MTSTVISHPPRVIAYYAKERAAYPAAYSLKLTDEHAKKIVRKLCNHFIPKNHGFHLVGVELNFHGNRQNGRARLNGTITLSHTPSLGLICHEVGHLVDIATRKPSFRKRNWHTKHLMRIVGKLIAYCQKKNLWSTHQ